MADRFLGRSGSKRRRRLLLVLPVAAVAALVLALSGSADNGNLTGFEIDGDIFSGVSNVGPTNVGPDWIQGTAGTGVLVCPSPCTPAAVADNPADPGEATFFRDPLKVDPDPTTFTSGDKENDFSNVTDPPPPGGALQSNTPWHIVSGSVPPQKDDLFDVVTYTRIIGGDAELDLGMLRTNNNGDSHVDFELNRLPWAPCASDATKLCPVRTEGDLLVSFEITTGGITPRFFVWDLPGGTDGGGKGRGGPECQGPLSGNEKPCPWEEISPPLTSQGEATVKTAVNTSDVPAGPWGSRTPSGDPTNTIPPGGWFEASLDLDGLGFPPSCPGFGQASAKSRSSSSIPAALHDLAGPFPIDLNTCGKITIIKDTVPDAAQNFHYTTTGGLPTDGAAGGFDLDDDSDATLSNTKEFTNVTPGSYTVTEGSVTGYSLTSLLCTAEGVGSSGSQDAVNLFKANIVVGNLGHVTCTYTNTLQQGAIKVTKTTKRPGLTGPQPQSGVKFTVNGVDKTTGADGTVCFDGLNFGSYNVVETVPAGYQADGATTKSVLVDNNANCSDNPYVGETVAFSNSPLTDVTISVDSKADGGTASTVDCDDNSLDFQTGANGDGTKTSGAVAGSKVITCTITIDP